MTQLILSQSSILNSEDLGGLETLVFSLPDKNEIDFHENTDTIMITNSNLDIQIRKYDDKSLDSMVAVTICLYDFNSNCLQIEGRYNYELKKASVSTMYLYDSLMELIKYTTVEKDLSLDFSYEHTISPDLLVKVSNFVERVLDKYLM